MRHPLSGKVFHYYISIWAVIFIAHLLFLGYNQQVEYYIAATDSFVYNFMLAGFGLSYWYVVKFLPPKGTGVTNMLLSHIIGISLVATIISYASYHLLNRFFIDNDYNIFLTQTIFWRTVLAILYMVIIVMIYYLLQYNFSLQTKEREEIELQNMLRNAELDMLKFQLNPHFIFNSLNSISSLTITAPERAQEMVIKLSEFLRSSLGNQHEEMHSLEDEFINLSLYLEIEKVRFGDRLVIRQSVDDRCKDHQVPHLILQPIYENAIKYGLYENLGEVVINTSCKFVDDHLIIEITNSYDPESEGLKGKGIGLANIKKRLEIIYQRDDLLEVSRDDHLFKTRIQLPKDA